MNQGTEVVGLGDGLTGPGHCPAADASQQNQRSLLAGTRFGKLVRDVALPRAIHFRIQHDHIRVVLASELQSLFGFRCFPDSQPTPRKGRAQHLPLISTRRSDQHARQVGHAFLLECAKGERYSPSALVSKPNCSWSITPGLSKWASS